jgi:hypothetical protein
VGLSLKLKLKLKLKLTLKLGPTDGNPAATCWCCAG